MIQFIVSLDILIQYAITNPGRTNFLDVDIDLDLPEIEEKPLFFETIHQLLIYYPVIFDAIHLYYLDSVKRVKYLYVLRLVEKNSNFYMNLLKLPSIKVFGLVLANDQDIKNE